MKKKNLRILANYQAKHRQDQSGLFDYLDLIKDAWEAAGFGVPTIIKILQDEGVTEGLSLSNVQGFVSRAQKNGIIGEKGSRMAEMTQGLKDFEKPHPISEESFDASDQHSGLPVITDTKENKDSPHAKTNKDRNQKAGTQIKAEIGEQIVPASGKEHIILPEKGPIDENTWRVFADQEGFPVDSSGNIDCGKYAQQLGQEVVNGLKDSDYQRFSGYIKSWRSHPDRNISQTWAAGVIQRAPKLKRQMRLAVGLK